MNERGVDLYYELLKAQCKKQGQHAIRNCIREVHLLSSRYTHYEVLLVHNLSYLQTGFIGMSRHDLR